MVVEDLERFYRPLPLPIAPQWPADIADRKRKWRTSDADPGERQLGNAFADYRSELTLAEQNNMRRFEALMFAWRTLRAKDTSFDAIFRAWFKSEWNLDQDLALDAQAARKAAFTHCTDFGLLSGRLRSA